MKKLLSILMVLILAVSLLPISTDAATKELKVHFIDVGQGDAILIQSPDGKNMLVDGGPKSASKTVVDFLKAKGVKKLDYVVATHPDADHIGGLIAVLNAFPVTNFVNSGAEHTTQTYFELLTLVDDKNINYIEPEIAEILIGDFTSDFYLQVLYVDSSAKDMNDASIVIKTGYKKVDFFLMADADTEIENFLMNYFDDISVDVLKVGHHGSKTSSSAAFINNIKPSVGILSYGKNNSYGHPHATIEARLKKVGAKTYKTAVDCDITVTTDGVKNSVSNSCGKTEANPAPAPTPTPEPKPEAKPAPAPSSGGPYKNCTEMRKDHPKGVQVGHPAYEKKHDRDGDGWACEPR
ncbi:MBL fold metallo-hydrolase [Sporosarcina luteola]|uniref:MBL fold metallo-hydrolase n=1 Tax=Sporosarcina luteola TaxID=582850 RepID=UPI002040E37D|nr:MBL fold metallo-hydrolase [Sporosarcina luteola]MCM3711055.1 MBL fold metallo-hydrolase [Sporosarcina luteola]